MVRVKMLRHCDFPIVQKKIDDSHVLVIPPQLLTLFDEGGYHAIRVYSGNATPRLPHFGGGTAQGRSQVPHQDHNPRDRRRFIAFSKHDNEPRGSATYLVDPTRAHARLPWLLAQFEMRREAIKREFEYRPPYMISRDQLAQCFEPGGLERLVASIVGDSGSTDLKLYTASGILTYLFQDKFGDDVVKLFLMQNSNSVWIERWNKAGLLIIDNSRVFHGRRGPNVPLQRNWLVVS